MRALIALPLLAGCDLLFGLDHVSALPPDADPSTIDADIGMVVDAGICMGTTQQFGRSGPGGIGLFSLCLTPSLGTLALDGSLDTNNDPRCLLVEQDTIGTSVCVIASEHIAINALLKTGGLYPLVVIGFKTITVNATIDAAAHFTGSGRAPGSDWKGCGYAANGPAGSPGGGGGAGGSFGTIGGNGGSSGQGLKALAKPAAVPDRVRGGCSGGLGGSSSATIYNARALAGASGGAVYLIAGASIDLTATGVINASGSAGHGGEGSRVTGGGGGGGAGGSGGLIGLDAPLITIHASTKLFANGGGGGGGGGLGAGNNGADPSAATVTMRAAGGAAINYGGAGGAGAAAALQAAAGGSAGSGGGGGGGAGVIKIYTPTPPVQPVNVSPRWQTN